MTRKPKQNFARKILSIFLLGFVLTLIPLVHAQEGSETNGETLYEPIKKQIIQITDEGSQPDWNISELETYGIKFLIRGKEALTWTLNIEDGGFHNPAIEATYIKVLTIVNSLFILGLLAIAIMWMFSIIIPRKYLKKVILIYALSVIFVNFALPINQLLIDGTNLLQKTLLMGRDGNIEITDIVQTPPYAEALSYRNEEAVNLVTVNQKITVDLSGEGVDIPIGKISIPGQSPETISLTSNPIEVSTNGNFSVFQEQTIFRFLIMTATGLAYFIIALIFVIRIVILWALLILSPILLILGIFKTTRGWFFNWLHIYGKWLLIGPIVALGIAIIVNIWQLSGLPISVSEDYNPEVFTTVKDSNILFYLPGKDTANTLSNTQEMMEYLVFLIMLYLPIFMAIALTKKRIFQTSAEALSKKVLSRSLSSQSELITSQEKDVEIREREKESSFMGNLKTLMSEKIGLITEASISTGKIKTQPEKPTKMMETASNFLPERLQNTPVPKMLELLGREKDSKKSHNRVIERLAHTEQIKESKEKQQVESVLSEIRERARGEDREAIAILHEIEIIKQLDTSKVESPNAKGVRSSINIQIGDEKPEYDRRVKDRSENEDNGKNNVKKKRKRKHKHKHNKKGPRKPANPDQNAN